MPGWAAPFRFGSVGSYAITDIKLRHRLHDTLANETEPVDHRSPRTQHVVELNLDWRDYFVHDDLKLVPACSPRQSLVVLGWYGLWS